MTYLVGGRQYVAIASGARLLVVPRSRSDGGDTTIV